MNGLAHLFAKLEQDLSRPKAQKFPGISRNVAPQLERQATDIKHISSFSSVSRASKAGSSFLDSENAQARAGMCGGARARSTCKNNLETLETLEKQAPAEGYLSSTLSRKLEKLEKSDGIDPLRAHLARLSPDDRAAFDERAGFLEHDCGLPRDKAERQALAEICGLASEPLPEWDGLALWRAGLDRLDRGRPPCPGYRLAEWPRTLARAIAFIDTFGDQAEALGWTAPRLFGVHPTAGIVRMDACGALVLPIGGPVLAITATEIRFSHLTHREKPGQPAGVPLWEIG